MNKVSYKRGDAVPTTQTLNYAQDAVLGGFRSITASFTADAVGYRVHGAVYTGSPTGEIMTMAVTPGAVVFQGEPMVVEAHSLDRAVTEVGWLEPFEEVIDATPTNNEEGVGRSVKVKRTMKLRKGDNYPASGSYMPLDAPTELDLLIQKLSGRLMPTGAIFPYNGEINQFDSSGLGLVGTSAQGLAICNGLNGTLDMRGLVAAGAVNVPSSGAGAIPANVTTETNVGDVFGTEAHQLTIDEMPEHDHDFVDTKPTFSSGTPPIQNGDGHVNTPSDEQTGVTGGNQAHENRQPTRALIYVQVIV